MPATQLLQIAAPVEPNAVEYVPRLQDTHTLAPVVDMKVPPGHVGQVAVVRPKAEKKEPAAQLTQVVTAMAPMEVEYLPVPQ